MYTRDAHIVRVYSITIAGYTYREVPIRCGPVSLCAFDGRKHDLDCFEQGWNPDRKENSARIYFRSRN